MTRYCFFVLALFGTLSAADRSPAARRGEIVPETTANRHGLTRAWYTQVQMDRARARVAHIVLHEGTLFVQTDQAVLHAIDAETGQTLWAGEVGRRGHPSMAPSANSNLVAVVNGSFLYVVNRFNGKLLWKAQVDGAPGAGPALSEQRAYVPMVDGLVLSYQLQPLKDPLKELGKIRQEELTLEEREVLESERREAIRLRQEYVPPLACQSVGRSLVQPIITRQTEGDEFVAWPTDRGFLFVGHVNRLEQDRFTVRYRLQTEAGIAAQPSYLPPDPRLVGDSGVIFGASRDGFVHAITESDGESLWRFSTGEPILEPVAVIGQHVFVATQPGGMYCLTAKTGSEVWWTPQVSQFIAASQERVYVADKLGRVLILDAKTGARLDSFPAVSLPIRLINTQTDRIYLATDTGLLQCFHEIELSEPLDHRMVEEAEPDRPAPIQQEGLDQAVPQPLVPPKADPFGGAKPGGAGDPFN